MLIAESFAGSTSKVRVLIFISLFFSNPGRSKGSYSPHLRRQEADLRVFLEDETLVLDPHIDYHAVPGLSSEVRERLFAVRPTSIVSISVQKQILHSQLQGRSEEDGGYDTDLRCLTIEIRKADSWKAKRCLPRLFNHKRRASIWHRPTSGNGHEGLV